MIEFILLNVYDVRTLSSECIQMQQCEILKQHFTKHYSQALLCFSVAFDEAEFNRLMSCLHVFIIVRVFCNKDKCWLPV